MRSTLLLAVALVTVPIRADAQVACAPGSFTTATSTFQVDANRNGTWDGDAGGDRTTQIAAYLGPGEPLVGDWNGDGYDDAGVRVGNVFALDLDGDGVWEGNAGGDRATSFAASFGPGAAIVGDWNGDGRDQIGVFLSEDVRFLLDANGNGVWDGTGGGDENVVLAKWYGISAGRIPLVGDWNGDGGDAVGLTTGSGRLYLDLNGNHQWDGAAGGDFAGVSGFMQLVGDWNGDGRDDNGRFLSDVFLVDFYGDRGASFGGGEDFPFATQFTPGTPLVCDWDDDGTTNLGKVVGDRFLLDLNANGSWDGNALGDRNTGFAIAPDGPPLAGRWAP